MRAEVKRSLARFWAAGIGGADFFVSAIGPALSVYSRFAEVRYSSGQPVSVANFLSLVRQATVDFSLERALAGADVGEVDRETQFALLWRWTYGRAQVETGAARLLDKATGVELSELEKRGILARVENGEKMVLLGPAERKDLMEGTLRRAMAGQAPIVDVIHCACILWRDDRREELDALLATQGDTTRRVAQALADLQAHSNGERRLILGFLGAWRHTAGKAGEDRKAEQLKLEM
jgi:adenine-specific DNA methylase